MKVFSGSSNKPLAEKIAHALNLKLSPLEIFIFPDGERRIQIQEKVVDEECVVVQSTAIPADQNYMELFFIIDGLKRSGAKDITVVVPYLGYQRQDHIFRDGEAVSLDVVAHAMEGAGATKVITFDLHSIKIPEVFKIPVVHLSALPMFAEEIEKLGDGILTSPDMGGLRRIQKMSELLDNMPWIATVKDRDLETGKISIETLHGEEHKIKKTAFIIDDMISSGGTMIKSAELLRKKGVEKIIVFATHAIFSNDAPELLQKSLIEKVYVTDSVFVSKEKHFPKLEILSIAGEIASSLKASSQ